MTKDEFYAEYVYAVYVAGFKVEVIKGKWSRLAEVYRGFKVDEVVADAEAVRREALKVIENKRKVDAVIRGAEFLKTLEWERFKKDIAENVDTLRRLPYIGDVLKYQLARNLGFDTIKPDVHLVRLAKLYGTDPFTRRRIQAARVVIL